MLSAGFRASRCAMGLLSVALLAGGCGADDAGSNATGGAAGRAGDAAFSGAGASGGRAGSGSGSAGSGGASGTSGGAGAGAAPSAGQDGNAGTSTGAGRSGSGGAALGGRGGSASGAGGSGGATGGSAGNGGEADGGEAGSSGGDCTRAVAELCATLPHFDGEQLVDGVGDEFCNVPVMTFEALELPWKNPAFDAEIDVTVELRAAWSEQAFHAHVHVMDGSVSAMTDSDLLWNGDNVQFFVAGTDTLTGGYAGTEDGGAAHLILAPPAPQAPNGSGTYFFETEDGTVQAPLDASSYRARLVPDGYEVELRLAWPAAAEPREVGRQVGFDFMLGASNGAGLELEAALSNAAPPEPSSCQGDHTPGCDDRTWCLPELGAP